MCAAALRTGLFFTIRTRGVQFRCFGEGWKKMFGGFSLSGGDHGGPVYYITTAFKGTGGRFLAAFFSVAIILALGFIGCMVQSNSIAETMNNATGIPTWVVGVVVAALAGFVFIGNVHRLASVTEKLVPLMAVIYLFGGLILLIMNAGRLPGAITLIFTCALSPASAMGGAFFGLIAPPRRSWSASSYF